MTKCLLASLLVVWLANPAFAAYGMTAQSPGNVCAGYGHPNPCWCLRLQRHRSDCCSRIRRASIACSATTADAA
jgi:hypothetical protein